MKTRSTRWLAGAILSSAMLLSLGAMADGAKSSSLQFHANGPGGLDITGEGGPVLVHGSADAWEFEARIDSLKTGIDMRDEHLKKYLEAARFPSAKLVVPRGSIPIPADGQASEGIANGQLTFHGQTKPVSVPFKVTRSGGELTGQGRIEFDLPTFGVEVPCYLGVCVDKHVKVKVKAVIAAQ